MSNKIYFCGFRLEHFKGWNGSGDPSYSAVSSSDTNSYNSVGSITLGSSSDVVWGDVNSDNNSSLYVLWYLNSSSGCDSNLVLIDSSNTALEIISTNTTISASYGTYNSTTKSIDNLTSLVSKTISSQTRPFISVILDYDGTSGKYNNIRIYSSIDGYNPEIKVLEAKLKTSMINIQSLYSSYITSKSNLYYIVVTNFDSRSGYLDYAEANAVGSVSGWTGDVSTFATYPVEYDTINYTNGYSGSYNISIPNYLKSGTGISVVAYMNSTNTLQLFGGTSGYYHSPNWNLNTGYGGTNVPLQFEYSQYTGNQWITFNSDSLFNNEWNLINIYNNNGVLNVNINGNISTIQYDQSETNFRLSISSNTILAGMAYTKSTTVNYPFNEDSNVTSYIDFADPNNPVVYGDTTQFSITSKSLTSVTPISNIPPIQITSTNTNYNGYLTTSDSLPVSTTGGGMKCFSCTITQLQIHLGLVPLFKTINLD